MKFVDKLKQLMAYNHSLICVGLDSDSDKIGKIDQYVFNKKIVDQTHDQVCAYKINTAFYESMGIEGLKNLKLTCDYIRDNYAEIPIILDAKRGDIGNTNEQYAKFAFTFLSADAVTVHPYQGLGALTPFEKYEDRGIIVLVKTSNPESSEIQDLLMNGEELYKKIAKMVATKWQENHQWMIVAGATHPEDLALLRTIIQDMPILVPGVGAQGAELKDVLNEGTSRGGDLIINVSRSVIFSDNPHKEVELLRQKTESYARSK